MKFKVSSVIILAMLSLLQSCGSAHVKPNIVSGDLNEYATASISSINIESREQNGDSLEMNRAMEAYAREKLGLLISENLYIEQTAAAVDGHLEFNLEMDIVYGSRAARYWVGFGAGKGTVRSSFTVVDSKTKQVKYSSTGESDLAMGAFGGSMEAVIKKNIDKLLEGFDGGAR